MREEYHRQEQRPNQDYSLGTIRRPSWLEQRDRAGAGMGVGDKAREAVWSQVLQELEDYFEDLGFPTERNGAPRQGFQQRNEMT